MIGKTIGQFARIAAPERGSMMFAQWSLVHDPGSNAAECRKLGDRVSMSFKLLLEVIHSETMDTPKRGCGESSECASQSPKDLSLLYSEHDSAPVAL